MWIFTPEFYAPFPRRRGWSVELSGLRVPRRFFPLYAFAAVFIGLSMITRLALLLRPDTPLAGTGAILHVMAVGLGYDLAAAGYLCAPFALYLAFVPNAMARWRWHKALAVLGFGAFVYGLAVVAVSEWVFWDEFASRFNFIAVDYLVYTHEVLGNIWESYPVGTWLALLLIPAI